MQNGKYIVRQASVNDDISKIAKYIYLTDPYIYPTICDSPQNEQWIAFIQQCFLQPNNVYNCDNVITVTYNEEIIGIACVIPCGKKSVITEGLTVPPQIKDGLRNAVNGYFNPLIEESLFLSGHNVVNICIDENHRGKKLGSLLLDFCIKKFEPHGDVWLDVIASNIIAIELYKKSGFCVIKEYNGFSGTDAPLPCFQMIKKARANR